eukprot:5009345-Alexandrium_andersonii.AAC.1
MLEALRRLSRDSPELSGGPPRALLRLTGALRSSPETHRSSPELSRDSPELSGALWSSSGLHRSALAITKWLWLWLKPACEG